MESDSEFDLSSAIEQIQSMMSTDDGQAKLNNIISAFMGSDDSASSDSEKQEKQTENQNHTNNPGFGDFGDINQIDMMIKLGNIMSALKSEQNSNSENLLYAIKPYLRKSRQDRTDGAIKIMGMVKAFAMLKDSGINLNF